MAKPFTIQNWRFQLPAAVTDPIAVMWNNTILVLAVNDEKLRNVVFLNLSGEWIQKKTRGIVPGDIYYSDYSAQVIEDKMFFHVKQYGNFRAIYCLDLSTWIWAKITPGGLSPPLKHPGGLSSWVYKKKIFHYVVGKELFCYNTSKNIWEWPTHRGEIPSLYGDCVATIVDDTVFLFNDGSLYTMDMESMIWTKVHRKLSNRRRFSVIKNFSNVTLAKVSQSTAILIGETRNSMDCWLLDIQKAKQLTETSSIWTKIQLSLPITRKYAAVLTPKGQELLLIGGKQFGSLPASNVLKITIRFSLMSLAIDYAARNTCTFDPRLQSNEFPAALQKEILMYKQEFIGSEPVCTKEEGCVKCYFLRFQSEFQCLSPKKRKVQDSQVSPISVSVEEGRKLIGITEKRRRRK